MCFAALASAAVEVRIDIHYLCQNCSSELCEAVVLTAAVPDGGRARASGAVLAASGGYRCQIVARVRSATVCVRAARIVPGVLGVFRQGLCASTFSSLVWELIFWYVLSKCSEEHARACSIFCE